MKTIYSNYTVIYRDQNGNGSTVLGFTSLSYVKKENTIGTLTLALPDIYGMNFFVPDGRIEVWRSIAGNYAKLELETSWLIRKIRYYTTAEGESGVELTCRDLLDLIDRRIVAYESGSSYSSKNDNAETIIKDLVSENLGVAAFDTTRDLSAYLSVQATQGYGAIIQKDCSWARLFPALQEVASASEEAGAIRIIFDVVYLNINSFQFQVWKDYRGIDRGVDSLTPLIVSHELGNLSAPELVMDYSEEINYAYAGGRGEGAGRDVQEAYSKPRMNVSPFNRREGFVDARNSYSNDTVLDEAYSALFSGRPRMLFSGNLLQTPSTVYGVHYNYGDKIVAKYKGFAFDCRIDAIEVKFDNNGEEINTRLVGEQYIIT